MILNRSPYGAIRDALFDFVYREHGATFTICRTSEGEFGPQFLPMSGLDLEEEVHGFMEWWMERNA